ncbi:hypothetical protein B0F90DRAFT_1818405 [Multifurca ochricompacta]|uniref:Uncharacterized protein n=1 Tax=Multifurca ochricompacta TaxID=376703 RepID=A0AAD4M1U4_9AGAM|nr:hypothetical protein B0F90DRAFT_1818405 [Multifurca ochricompacta]
MSQKAVEVMWRDRPGPEVMATAIEACLALREGQATSKPCGFSKSNHQIIILAATLSYLYPFNKLTRVISSFKAKATGTASGLPIMSMSSHRHATKTSDNHDAHYSSPNSSPKPLDYRSGNRWGRAFILRRVTIEALPDHVLLEIFDFYRMGLMEYLDGPWEWQTLVHATFGSATSLHSRNASKEEHRLLAGFAHHYPISKPREFTLPAPEDEDNIIAALERSGRLWSVDEAAPVLPNEFLGRSAPLLQSFSLGSIPFPALSTSDLLPDFSSTKATPTSAHTYSPPGSHYVQISRCQLVSGGPREKIDAPLLDVVTVEGLNICANSLHPGWKDDMDPAEWLELLRAFTSVERLFLCNPPAGHVIHALKDLGEEITMGVLPALRSLFLEAPQSVSMTHPFLVARRLSDHLVSVRPWKRQRSWLYE